MKYFFPWTLLLLCTLMYGARGVRVIGPIAMDWHHGGYLYVVYSNGDVYAYDERGRPVRKFYMEPGFLPAEIVSAKVHGIETLFISGFRGREGAISVWDSDTGREVGNFPTPELAAGIDIDPGTSAPRNLHILYIASAVENSVYSVNLDGKIKAEQLAFIRGAKSLGPVVFDQSRNRLFIGDQGSGSLYEVDCETGRYYAVATGIGTPISLALDGTSGLLYVADAVGARIHTFTIRKSDGKLSQSALIRTDMDWINAISLGPDNSLYVATRTDVFQLSLETGAKSLIGKTEAR